MGRIVGITAAKEFAILSALKPIPLAPRHRPFQVLGGWFMCPWYGRRY